MYVTGFSQGASAATALGGALERGADGWFRLGALAPVSGAFARRGSELPALLGSRAERRPIVVGQAFGVVAQARSCCGIWRRWSA